jgi:hypothetical protein
MKIIASLVALAAAAAVAAPALGVTPRALVDDAAPHQDDQNFVSAVMRAHWYWRHLHCAQELVWDPELANEARADIEECPHDPEHVSCAVRSVYHHGLTHAETLGQQPLFGEPCA